MKSNESKDFWDSLDGLEALIFILYFDFQDIFKEAYSQKSNQVNSGMINNIWVILRFLKQKVKKCREDEAVEDKY